MGCNFCDDCSDCTVGGDIDCGAWDPDEHREEHFAYDYDDEYHDKAEDMDVGKEQHCVNCGELAQLDWSYCLSCGAALPKKHCVKCGERVASDWGYCPWCGSMIPDKIIATAQSSSRTSSNWAVQTGNDVYDDGDIPF